MWWLSLLACSEAEVVPATIEVAPAPVVAAAPAPAHVWPRAERRARKARGFAAYDAKDWDTCITEMEAAGEWYDAACCSALSGRTDEAFVRLGKAVDGGWHDIRHLAEDPDFASLHADPRWNALLVDASAKRDRWAATVNQELAAWYEEDQLDRDGSADDVPAEVAARDAVRRQAAEALLAAGALVSAEDHRHAATLFYHGPTVEDAKRANELAKRAIALGMDQDEVRWLAAAAEDRALMLQGQAQRYGTQFVRDGSGWVLWQLDPNVTDEERDEWAVPPLAEAQAKLAVIAGTR